MVSSRTTPPRRSRRSAAASSCRSACRLTSDGSSSHFSGRCRARSQCHPATTRLAAPAHNRISPQAQIPMSTQSAGSADHHHGGHDHIDGHDPMAHTAHAHAGHHVMVHAPPADVAEAYRQAYEQAEPDPGGAVVSVELEAREADWQFMPGRTARAWTFNGQVPGPVIEARVGDVLEVRLTNRLSEPTTLHWHGVRLPAAMDGTDMVQHPVEPRATFVYRIKLLDAGTFWYHSHSNETVQVNRGMYGALIVRGENEPVLDRERVLVLSDAPVDPTGEVWSSSAREGRDGNLRLVNGAAEPELMIRGGQVERWRVINASSARYVKLSIGRRPFWALGTGG